ncbi:MAG: DUF4129 domain-containing protein, partial [Terriglobales bacterium]
SWVEAYFPGYGWIAFDPTPSAIVPARTGWSRAMLYVDAMESFWREWIVNYDAGHQQTLAADAAGTSRRLMWTLRRWWHHRYKTLLAAARRTEKTMAESPLSWGSAGALAALLLALAVNGRQLWQALARRRLAARPERSPRKAATIWYERMTAIVARRGWRKSPAQTPREFVQRINDTGMRVRVAEFTRFYESARFDDSVADVRRLPELYEEIAATRRR